MNESKLPDPHEILTQVGLPHRVSFSRRLREQFGLSRGQETEWLDLFWAIRCTVTGCLPAIELSANGDRVQVSEFLSLPAASPDPVSRTIAVIHQSPTVLHVVLPEEVQFVPPLVLVVEDDPDLGRLALQIIRCLGVDAAWEKNGEAGWDSIQARLPVVVLTDVDMPLLNGLELCRRIKTDPLTKHIAVLVWSGNPQHESEARESGAAGFLNKPVEMQQLITILRKLIKG